MLRCLFAAIVLCCAASSTASARTSLCNDRTNVDPSLMTYLKDYVAQAMAPIAPDPVKVGVAKVAAKDKEGFQYLVYLDGHDWCGVGGGCVLLILRPHGATFDVISETPKTYLPIRVLDIFNHGRPDIGIEVAPMYPDYHGYEAIMSFNGTAYPNALYGGSPQVKNVDKRRLGRVVIPSSKCEVALK